MRKILVCLALAVSAVCYAQGVPITTEQVNDNFLVGSPLGNFMTVQLGVTAACAQFSSHGRVTIIPSYGGSDSITAATGCQFVTIVDQRGNSGDTCYSWGTSGPYAASDCVAISSGGITAPCIITANAGQLLVPDGSTNGKIICLPNITANSSALTIGNKEIFAAQGTATSGANFDSAQAQFNYSFWNSSAAVLGNLMWVAHAASGANPTVLMTLTNSGTTGPTGISVPHVVDTSLTVNNCVNTQSNDYLNSAGAPCAWFGTGNSNFGGSLPLTSTGTLNADLGGQGSLVAVTSGYGLTAGGNGALASATTSFHDVGMGLNSLTSLNAGAGVGAAGDVGYGVASGAAAVIDWYLTAIGTNSCLADTTSFGVTCVGADSFLTLNVTANSTPGTDTIGQDTALGYNSGAVCVTCQFGTYVGAYSTASSASAVNENAIGYGATGNGSNTVTLGNTSVAHIYMGTTQMCLSTGVGCPSTAVNAITALTGDVTATGPGSAAATLATVNSGSGACGDATHVCAITTNGKGLTTAQTSTAITFPGSLPPSGTAGGVLSGTYPNPGFASITANSLLGNTTGSSAAPSANSLPSCSTGIQALNYTSGSGFGCVTINSGFPIILGSTSIAAGSTTTALTGLAVNGVTLNSAGSSGLYLGQDGVYHSVSGLGNPFATGVQITGTDSAATGTSRSDYVFESGQTVIRSFGPNTSTIGGFSLQGITSTGAVTAFMGCAQTLSGYCQFPQGVNLGGNATNTAFPLCVGALTMPCAMTTDLSGNTVAKSVTGTDGTQGLVMQAFTGAGGYGAIYPVGVTPSGSNFTLAGGAAVATAINAPSGTAINLLINAGLAEAVTSTSHTFSQAAYANCAGLTTSSGVMGCSTTGFPVSNPITTATGGSGTGTVTCLTATCTNLRGTYSIAGGTFTTGNLLSLVWPTTTTAYACTSTMNGGTGFLGIGNDVATATGMNITNGVTVLGLTVVVNYSCEK